MKKLISLSVCCFLLLCSCGVGSYSVSSGRADEGMLSIVSAKGDAVSVNVDGEVYDIHTVKTKAWRKDRNIKKTAKNTIFLAPGQHNVVITSQGREIFSKTLFISAQEHKIVEL